MLHKHCWHEDRSTRRKVRNPEKCKSIDPNYLWHGDYGWVIRFRSIEECCICHKKRFRGGKVGSEGLDYLDILDEPLTIK